MKLLVLGDIHGRTFWKKAVEKYAAECNRIVFLGDYLDSYPCEGITRRQTIKNFEEIIDYKAANNDKVILLLGNHDLPYIDKRNFYTRSRYDSSNARHIQEMFRSHRSLFQLAHEEYMNGKGYLFTHAGLIPRWYERHTKDIDKLTVESLNHLLDSPNGIRALCEVSHYRGGWDRVGSIVWCDIIEMEEETQRLKVDENVSINDKLPWDYQIFGHSQQESEPIITKEFACLDCRKAFILNDEGGFEEC